MARVDSARRRKLSGRLRRPAPPAPFLPKELHGKPVVAIVVCYHGDLEEGARVLKPLPFGLDAAALNAVKQWKFQPGTLNGQPVPVYYNLTVNFRIE